MALEVFSIVRNDGAWAVEHGGAYSHRSRDKAEVQASASKMARAAMGQGKLVQIKTEGESGFYAAKSS